MSRRRPWWLAACLFALHNGEEIVARPPMRPGIGEREFAIGAIAVTMIVFGLTAWAGRYEERQLACWSMLLLQSVILLNVAVHLFFGRVYVGRWQRRALEPADVGGSSPPRVARVLVDS